MEDKMLWQCKYYTKPALSYVEPEERVAFVLADSIIHVAYTILDKYGVEPHYIECISEEVIVSEYSDDEKEENIDESTVSI